MRKDVLVEGQYYHIFNKSIANYEIFNNADEFLRMKQSLKYYQIENDLRFSGFMDLTSVERWGFDSFFKTVSKDKNNIVQIIAYCLMPTHFHLIVKQLDKNGISKFISKVLNSYTRYFNTIHKRKGPLWESEFQNVLIINDEQLLHLTRYIHLNPVTAHLINKPEKWLWSSYNEYISKNSKTEDFCHPGEILEIHPEEYRKFVNDRISYQRELTKIKALIID